MTRELAPEAWAEYFHWLSKELPGARVSIEVVEPPSPSVVKLANLELLTLFYDRREDLFVVAAARGGGGVAGTMRHVVDQPERVYVDSDVMLPPLTVAVDARGGVRTVIRLEDGAGPC